MNQRHKSMKAFGDPLANANAQVALLEEEGALARFDETFRNSCGTNLRAGEIEVFQMNLGKMCNQVCKHCHVDAGPDRKEIMTRETMKLCLEALAATNIPTVDLTGGAPEMNPDFKWFVDEVKKLNRHVIVRSNLTILVTNGFEEYAEFMAERGVEIVSSLPFYKAGFTDRQRGDGVFEKSVRAMQILNSLGYGKPDTGLVFHLVYNPVGAFLPSAQESLEKDYKRELAKHFDIEFNNLFTITNMPISRFLDYLLNSGNYDAYMEKLIAAFNPAAAENVMCRYTLSIGWDGSLYDCDFNQMLELGTAEGAPRHISDFSQTLLEGRDIVTGRHCFGCTAGAGSSCGGATA